MTPGTGGSAAPSCPTPTCFGTAIPPLQVPRCLHKDIEEPLQVRGAGAVLRVELDAAGGRSGTCTPAPRRGHPPLPPRAHLKKGLCSCTRPSLERSLALVKSGAQPGGRLPASTAKPWFCAVMKQRRVSSCRQGWLCPRFPYLERGQGASGTPRRPGPCAGCLSSPSPLSLHLVGAGANGQGDQLVPQADPEDGLGLGGPQHAAQAGHCLLAELRVPGAVADEEPIEICAQTEAESQRGHRPLRSLWVAEGSPQPLPSSPTEVQPRVHNPTNSQGGLCRGIPDPRTTSPLTVTMA